MNWHKKATSLFFITLTISALFACSDDITKTTEIVQNGIPVIQTGENYPICDSTHIGEMVYLEDSLAVYYCSNEDWQAVKGKDGTNGSTCTVENIPNGYKIICGEDSVGVLQSTIEDKGSCNISSTSTGYDVYCGDKKVGELSNGEPGLPGSSGSKGDDCTLADNKDGTITQKCGNTEVTIYKALCGTTPYDPDGEKFCYGITLYDKCNGLAYDIKTETCVESTITK